MVKYLALRIRQGKLDYEAVVTKYPYLKEMLDNLESGLTDQISDSEALEIITGSVV